MGSGIDGAPAGGMMAALSMVPHNAGEGSGPLYNRPTGWSWCNVFNNYVYLFFSDEKDEKLSTRQK